MKIRIVILIAFSMFLFVAAQAQNSSLKSGPEVGKDCPAFDPRHVTGPDKGKKCCPMCMYGYQQGVLVWLNTDDFNSIAPMLTKLEAEIDKKGLKRIRVFVMYMNPERKSSAEVEKMLGTFAANHKLKKVALTYIPDPTDPETAGLYNINPSREVKNTVIVYRARSTFDKYINFESSESSIQALIQSVEKAERTKS